MKRSIVGLALALVLSVALSDGARAEKYFVDHDVWAHYQSYLKTIGAIRPGAYAITKDGHGAFYVYCQETRCVAGPSYGQDAVNRCEREYGTECVVFAVRDDIKVEYEIVDSGAGAPAAAPQVATTAPSPTTKPVVRISSALRDKVERYLNNSASFGNTYRFLAVNKDGTKIGISNCVKMTTWMTDACGGATSPYEGAKRVALNECGGPDQCHLIFEGARKIGDFEIEWYGSDSSAVTPPKPVETQPSVKSADSALSAPTAVASAAPVAPAPVVPPKPSLKIAVSSVVESDIESYLHNAHSTARLWAFAVAKNGSDAAMASCPAGGGWSGGGACEPVKGGPQELANREAIKKCGGPEDCVLLYVGETKATGIELAVQ